MERPYGQCLSRANEIGGRGRLSLVIKVESVIPDAAMRDQPVEDAAGKRGIADPPARCQRHKDLRTQDRRAHLIAILADLPESWRSGSDSGAMTPHRLREHRFGRETDSTLQRL